MCNYRVLLVFVGLSLLLTLRTATAAPGMSTQQQTIAGMPVTITVWAQDAALCARALELGFAEFRRIEQVFSAYRQGSQVNQINQNAGHQPVVVSSEVIDVLQWSRRISEASDGAFDITAAGFAWAYGFGQGDYRVPTPPRLEQIKTLVNYRYVLTYPADKTVVFKKDGVQIDLSELVKNYALNTVCDRLRGVRVQAALINAGGDAAVVNHNPEGGPWLIEIKNPREPNRLLAAIPMEQGKIVNASDNGRFFEQAGVRYHPILDVQTGTPVHYSQAATLLLPEHPKLDLPAEVLMLMPPEQAVKLVESIPGAQCLIVGAEKKVWVSSGWQKGLKVAW